MAINFEFILVLLTVLSGLICLVDSLFFARKRLEKAGVVNSHQSRFLRFKKVVLGLGLPPKLAMPKIIEYSRSFFPILFIVLFVRTFFYEPYRIPSGSDKPTLLIGDLILVNKHIYGWHWPISNHLIKANHIPKRGDIVVFRFSNGDPSKDLIKRVIGLPGDHVTYIDKELTINGIKAEQTFLANVEDAEGGFNWPVVMKNENLLGISHLIYQRPQAPSQNLDVIVPADHYFVLGDNRDDSYDSRYWGFVSQADLKGKAIRIWLSWNGFSNGMLHIIRWNRIGDAIQ